MTIRPFQPSDAPAVATLAAETWPRDVFMRAGHDQHGERCDAEPFRRCLVAVDETGEIIGVVSAIRPPAHPLRLELVGTIAAEHRREGIASALLDAIRRECPGEILRPRIRPDDFAARLFLATRGFTPLMRNRILAVDPTDPAVVAWCDSVPVPADYDLETDGLDSARVLDLCHAIYARGHQWNQPAEFSEEFRRDAFFGGTDRLPEPLIVATVDGQPVGIAYGQCEDGNDGEMFLMPSGVLGDDRPGAVEATAAMIAYCLTWARSRTRTVIFEVDDAEEHVAAVVAALPSRLIEELLHFELLPAEPTVSDLPSDPPSRLGLSRVDRALTTGRLGPRT